MEYIRPKEATRFAFGGLKTNCAPDAIPLGKFAMAVNVRAYDDTDLTTRTPLTNIFTTVGLNPDITDLSSFTTLVEDGLPHYIFRDTTDRLWSDLQLGSPVVTLTTNPNGAGACMIPFRPAESPIPYMYVANGADYRKVSAPNFNGILGVTSARLVGIAEAQSSVEAVPQTISTIDFSGLAASWTQGGTAGALSNITRTGGTITAAFADPANGTTLFPRVYLAVNAGAYQIGQGISIPAVGLNEFIEDVIPGMNKTLLVTVQAIQYRTGTTGLCVVALSRMSNTEAGDQGSIYTDTLISSLRRGAIVSFGGGVGETCLVLNASVGPDGSICIETSTVSTHNAGETLSGITSIAVGNIPNPAAVVGVPITSAAIQSTVTVGVGTATQTFLAGFGPFSKLYSGKIETVQDDDYIHLSIRIGTLANLSEMKIMFDVGNGLFNQNYYYYTIRPNDIQAGIANTLTQLGVAQLVTQRAIIDAEAAIEAHNQGKTASSAQTAPGDNQWSEVLFPVRSLTRVGNDQSLSLIDCVAVRILFNQTGTSVNTYGSTWIGGGGSPDVGPSGAPYKYLVVPRDAITGARGNPCPVMRYGVSPRRQLVTLQLPSSSYNTSIDHWDVYRYGGAVTSYRWIGTTPSFVTQFIDNFSDEEAAAGDAIDYDNFEPWPTIDQPINRFGAQAVGTLITVTMATNNNVLRYLPGNLINLGDANVFTLRSRPTAVTGGYLFEVVENAGNLPGASFSIYEPAMARQMLPYMWGPDAAGTVFAVGDPLRPGTVYFSKNYAPDAAPDKYNIEVTQPGEPLMGGETLDGLSFVASTERWWALYPQPGNPTQRYAVIQQPMTRGLAAPLGHTSDGRSIYWWAKDGIYSSADGSLTDADLSNLFPHEGTTGQDVTYAGVTIKAPDYSRAGKFRMAHANGYLYAIYQDSTGTYRTLVCDIKRKAWCVDDYSTLGSDRGAIVQLSCVHHPEQAVGTLTTTPNAVYPEIVMGTIGGGGAFKQSQPFSSTSEGTVASVVATGEYDGGDLRAGKQWGDLILDAIPAAKSVAMTVTPYSNGAPVPAPVTPTILTASNTRGQFVISLAGGALLKYLGLVITWKDQYAPPVGQVQSKLFLWQPSFLDKPETIADRFTDWDNAGTEGAKWFQGFVLHADTFNAVKGLAVRDSDAGAVHTFSPAVKHNGESVIAYSFDAPFVAHMARIEPTDLIPWRMFDVVWVAEPTPETAKVWQAQGTSFGITGYMHIQQVAPAYRSTAPVTLTITSYDGLSPAVLTLPTTGGQLVKTIFQLTPNKGQLYFFKATSEQLFQIYLDDCEVMVGEWGRQDAYTRFQNLGGSRGDKARI